MSAGRGPVRWLSRLGLTRPRTEESVAWEIEHHIAEAADRLVEAGWEPEAARREAMRRFGSPRRYAPPMRRLERRMRAVERWTAWADFVREAFVGTVRTARRSPGFALGVVLTLALGVGANATMYGIVDRLLLQPPTGVRDADRVRRVFARYPDERSAGFVFNDVFTYPDFGDLEAASSLSVAAYEYPGSFTVGAGLDAERVRAELATDELFPLLGVTPRLGRFYGPDDDRVGAPPTAVLGYEYWRRGYGSDPAVVGRTLDLSGRTYTIIGVAPPGFTGVGLEPVDVWLPLRATESVRSAALGCLERRGCWRFDIVARLADGVGTGAAEEEATRLTVNGRRSEAGADRNLDAMRIVLAPLIAARGPDASAESRVAGWLAGVSLIVLLVACANVANLLLARGARRRRELAVRLALGVRRRRLVGQMVVESVLLALAGGALAILLARWGGGVVRATLLPGVLFPEGATDARVLLFTGVISLLAGVLAGIGPALQSTRANLHGQLTEAGRGSAPRRSRTRAVLTAFQAAMSVVLLVGAGLFVRSLERVHEKDVGFERGRLLLARLELSAVDPDPAETNRVYARALEALGRDPGVEAAAGTNVPLGWATAIALDVPGVDSIPMLAGGGPYFYAVTSRYFRVAGIPIVRGRGFEDADDATGGRVAVVSETMARTLWPGEDALGRCIIHAHAPQCATIVGVARDAARRGLRDEPFMAYYLPVAQTDATVQGLWIRTRDAPARAAAEVARTLRSLSPEVRWASVRPFADLLGWQTRPWTLGAAMFTVFGLLALLVASVGLYAVLAFDVAQRTRELGIRTALGADRMRLLAGVLVGALRLAIVGVACGLAAAWLTGPYVTGLLFEVSPRDPVVLGGVAVALVIVAGVAGLVPGLRATRVDPVRALRAD